MAPLWILPSYTAQPCFDGAHHGLAYKHSICVIFEFCSTGHIKRYGSAQCVLMSLFMIRLESCLLKGCDRHQLAHPYCKLPTVVSGLIMLIYSLRSISQWHCIMTGNTCLQSGAAT